ncbi:MAG: FAD-dependent oxidoreductase, partial [Acidimicrobiales bacterium]
MTEARYDAIVVGAGAMGSAAGWWLARRGRRVLVIDQFEAGHERGSSHGTARIFRLGYAVEALEYATLAMEARLLWRQLEQESGTHILDPVGAVDCGSTAVVESVRLTFEHCGIGYEVLDERAASGRWKGIRFDGDVLFHRDGAVTRADAALRALHDQAIRHGAEIQLGVGRVRVETHAHSVSVAGEDFFASAPV